MAAHPRAPHLALNNANKAWELLQPNVAIEVVTYGPGMSLVLRGSGNEGRVVDLIEHKGVRFTLCEVTYRKAERKSGKTPVLIDGVTLVPSGTVKLMELQEDGYAYLRP